MSMSLVTEPFEFRYFSEQLNDWRNKQKSYNPRFDDKISTAEIKVIDSQLKSVLGSLREAPKLVAEKVYRFELCLIHSQSISSTIAKGIQYPELLTNDDPVQFLTILPYDKLSLRPFNKEQFIEAVCDLCFLAFDTILILESDLKGQKPINQIYLNSTFRNKRSECINDFKTFLSSNFDLNDIPKSYQGYF